MHTEPTTAQKLRQLPWMYLFNALNIAFCQLTVFGSVFLFYLDRLGLNKKQTGLILAMFPLCCIPAVFIGPVAARFGVKRIYLTFYLGRKLITGLLLFAPLFHHPGNPKAAFLFVAGVILLFSISRGIAETAYQAWYVELVPNSIRGRYAATVNVVVTLTAMSAMLIASFVLKQDTEGFGPFLWLIAVGVVAGLGAVASAATLPGGAPVTLAPETTGLHGMLRPLRDHQFRIFLCGMALVVMGLSIIAFLPLYMKDRVGLSENRAVLLDVVQQIAMLLVAIPWGWASDRYGSKPVSITGLSLLLLFPVLLLLIPKGDPGLAMPFAMVAVFVFAACNIGWSLGINRFFYNTLVPYEHRTTYTAFHFTWMGIFGAISPLVAGAVLDLFQFHEVKFLGVLVDGYVVLMALYAACLLGALLLFSRIRPPEGEIPALSFATMFFRGDPIGAIGALFSYNAVGGEQRRLSATERMGKARSPLNVNELVECLADPSYNVRYEAIISIARTRPHPKLTAALIEVLNSGEPDLAITAAWALGRIGDPQAIPALRDKLTAGYPLLAARCARALAMLGDNDSLPFLLARLRDEVDDGLRTAYASALGAIGTPVALPELLAFLRDTRSEPARFELALAITRIGGKEEEMVRLWRHMRFDRETALAQAVDTVRRQITRLYRGQADLIDPVRACSEAFDHNDLAHGVRLLNQLIARLPLETFPASSRVILSEVRERLEEFGAERTEYLLLAIDTLDQALDFLVERSRFPGRDPSAQPAAASPRIP